MVVEPDSSGSWGNLVEVALLDKDRLEIVLWPGLESGAGRWANLGDEVEALVEDASGWVVSVRFPNGLECLRRGEVEWPVPRGWEAASLIGDRVQELAQVLLPRVRDLLGLDVSTAAPAGVGSAVR